MLWVVLSAMLSWAQQPIDDVYEAGDERLEGGQVPIPPPFNPTSLDEETLDAYFLHLIEREGEAFAALAPADAVPVLIAGTAQASSNGVSEGMHRGVLGGQVPIPPPFNPTSLDAETLDAYFLDLIGQEGDAFAALVPVGDMPVYGCCRSVRFNGRNLGGCGTSDLHYR